MATILPRRMDIQILNQTSPNRNDPNRLAVRLQQPHAFTGFHLTAQIPLLSPGRMLLNKLRRAKRLVRFLP